MFFNNRKVTKTLKHEGFKVEVVWLDALSTKENIAYVGVRLLDEPIVEIAMLDLTVAVEDWATVCHMRAVGKKDIVALLVVRMDDFGTAMPL